MGNHCQKALAAGNRWQPLATHLANVAELAGRFATPSSESVSPGLKIRLQEIDYVR